MLFGGGFPSGIFFSFLLVDVDSHEHIRSFSLFPFVSYLNLAHALLCVYELLADRSTK